MERTLSVKTKNHTGSRRRSNSERRDLRMNVWHSLRLDILKLKRLYDQNPRKREEYFQAMCDIEYCVVHLRKYMAQPTKTDSSTFVYLADRVRWHNEALRTRR